METKTMGPMQIMGIQVRTCNDGRAREDLKHLWDRFFKEGIMDKIPDKTSNDIYAVYTDYESDHTGEYTTILGCRVTRIDRIPQGLVVKDLGDAVYKHIAPEGKLPDVVISTWTDIWNDKDLKRAFTADFEVYDMVSFGSDNAKVEIYVAVRR